MFLLTAFGFPLGSYASPTPQSHFGGLRQPGTVPYEVMILMDHV